MSGVIAAKSEPTCPVDAQVVNVDHVYIADGMRTSSVWMHICACGCIWAGKGRYSTETS